MAAAATMPQPLPQVGNPYGGPLTTQDYRDLAARWINRETADAAQLSRVPDHVGRELLNQRSKNCAGILIPYFLPGITSARSEVIRRDHPEIENGKPKQKYMKPAGTRNQIYFTPGTDPDALAAVDLPIVVTEGEFKVLALSRLASDNAAGFCFLPIGLSGVANWRGKIGIAIDATGARVPEEGPIPDLDRITWTGRRVYIAYDADVARKSDVKKQTFLLSRELRTRGAEVALLTWDEARGKGIDDWLANEGPEPVLAAFQNVDWNRTTGWRAKLRMSAPKKDGGGEKPLPLLINADIALRSCPDWEGVLAFDEFRQRVRIVEPAPIGGPVPRNWSDADDTKTAIWMQDNGINLGRDIVGQAVQSVARDNTVHPLRDWLKSLQWDKTPRVDTWLSQYLGVAPSGFSSGAGRMWLVSAIARVMQPGCQVDYVLILEGKQGLRKSTALRILATDEYFTDQIPDLNSKDAQMQTMGVWIMEFSELEGMRKHEAETLKAFITRRSERLRPPFGHHVIDVPRQLIFAGSTNGSDYLRDATGGRRFWPVECTHIRLEDLARDREQLWAEAAALYRAGAHWWPDGEDFNEEAEFQQTARLATDSWLEPVRAYVATIRPDDQGRLKVTAEDILAEVLRLDITRQGLIEKRRVGQCLRSLGWAPTMWRDEDDPTQRTRGFKKC